MSHPSIEIGPLPSVTDIEFMDRLGRGTGAGRFKARLEDGGRPVSLLLCEADADKAGLDAWARGMQQVDHPAVPPVRRVELVLEPPYVAFNYVDGQNLEARMALRGQGLAPVDALAVALQVAAALRAAHNQGVTHGSLNARSVLLVHREGAMEAVRVVGWTPPAPTSSFAIRAQTDLAALGQILYTCLTGSLPPSTQRIDLPENLEGGGGGSFDDILMDWAEVDSDLRGLGQPALKAQEGHYTSVDEFIDALLPHFRERVDEAVSQVGEDLARDQDFMTQVEEYRARQEDLERRLRYVREWLRENQSEIDRCEGQARHLAGRERQLQNMEVELAMLLDRSVRRRTSNRPARRRPESVSAPPRTRVERAAPITRDRLPPTTPPSAARPPEDAVDLLRGPESEPPPHRLEPSPSQAEASSGTGGMLLAALLLAVLVGVGGAALLMTRLGGPEGEALAEVGSPAMSAQAARRVDPPSARVAEPTPEPKKAVAEPAAEKPAPVEPAAEKPAPVPAAAPAAVAAEPDAAVAPAPVVEPAPTVGPAPLPLNETGPPPPPPEGMVLVAEGSVRSGLTAEQKSKARALCEAEIVDEKLVEAHCTDARFTEEAPAAPIEVTAFFIDRHEVSQADYSKCRNDGACDALKLHWDLDEQPATGVTHAMAAGFCAWRGDRLPTWEEWLRAARGDDQRMFPWGDEAPVVDDKHKENYGRWGRLSTRPSSEDGHKYAAPVGSFGERGKSPFGVYNMAGNVREWTSTARGESYVVAGGDWLDLGVDLRVTRHAVEPAETFNNRLGFRCARDLTGAE